MTNEEKRPYEFIGCLICGIKGGFSLYPDCKREAEKWGVKLVGSLETGQHIWTWMKRVDGKLLTEGKTREGEGR